MRLIMKNRRVSPDVFVSFIMLAIVLMRPVNVLAEKTSLNEYVGFWVVEIKKTNFLLGEYAGRGKHDVWEIRENQGKYELALLNYGLIFKNIILFDITEL